jgi:hypothetical protein
LKTNLLAADSQRSDANKLLKEKQGALDQLKHKFSEALAAVNKAKADTKKAAAAKTLADAALNAANSQQPVKRGKH